MTMPTSTTCHACGNDYETGVPAEQDYEICPDCRVSKQLYRIRYGADLEYILFAAGLEALDERIGEGIYWAYKEFTNTQWEALERHFEWIEDGLSSANIQPTDSFLEVQRKVKTHVDAINHVWDLGTKSGILERTEWTPDEPIRIEVEECMPADLPQEPAA